MATNAVSYSVDNSDPDILVIKSRFNAIPCVIGIVFTAIGIFLIATGLGYVPNGTSEAPPPIMVSVIGGVFGLIGLGLLSWRSRTILDRRFKQMAKRSRFFFVFSAKKTFPLEKYTEIKLSKEVIPTDKSNSIVYPVRLLGPDETMDLVSLNSYEAARRIAENASQFLKKPLCDSSSGEDVVRSHEDLNISLREQVRKHGEEIAVPKEPAQTRVRVSHQGPQVTVEIPPPEFDRKKCWLFAGVGAVVLLTGVPSLFYFKLGDFSSIPFGAVVFIAGPLIPLCVIGGMVLNLMTTSVQVRASTDGLSVVKKSVFGTSKKSIKGPDLEELSISHRGEEMPLNKIIGMGHTIIAKSDLEEISINVAGTKEEADYLYAVIKKALVD